MIVMSRAVDVIVLKKPTGVGVSAPHTRNTPVSVVLVPVPTTVFGVDVSVVLPIPSAPASFSPQHLDVLSLKDMQVCIPPVPKLVTVTPADSVRLTVTGDVFGDVVVPSPT